MRTAAGTSSSTEPQPAVRSPPPVTGQAGDAVAEGVDAFAVAGGDGDGAESADPWDNRGYVVGDPDRHEQAPCPRRMGDGDGDNAAAAVAGDGLPGGLASGGGALDRGVSLDVARAASRAAATTASLASTTAQVPATRRAANTKTRTPNGSASMPATRPCSRWGSPRGWSGRPGSRVQLPAGRRHRRRGGLREDPIDDGAEIGGRCGQPEPDDPGLRGVPLELGTVGEPAEHGAAAASARPRSSALMGWSAARRRRGSRRRAPFRRWRRRWRLTVSKARKAVTPATVPMRPVPCSRPDPADAARAHSRPSPPILLVCLGCPARCPATGPGSRPTWRRRGTP